MKAEQNYEDFKKKRLEELKLEIINEKPQLTTEDEANDSFPLNNSISTGSKGSFH